MTLAEFKERIKTKRFFGEDPEDEDDDGWRSDNLNVFTEIGAMLIFRGFSGKESLEILGRLYCATKSEYGD